MGAGRIGEKLQEGEEMYQRLMDLCPDAIVIIQGEGYRFINPSFTRIFGYTQQDVDGGLSFLHLVQESDKDAVGRRYQDRLDGKPLPQTYRIDLVAKDGTLIPCETSAAVIRYEGQAADLVIIRDITERKRAEEKLKRARDELEMRVKERTADLEEVNTALKVLLKQREEDKSQIEAKVLSNIKDLVLPYINKLKKSPLNANQMTFMKIIESNLHDIVSPFVHQLSSKYMSLSPTEILVAQFVREGKTTKEISEVMGSSIRTVESHREKIRVKLGLKNKRVNLRSYLASV
jgi:PAS domain S-box-containing protein